MDIDTLVSVLYDESTRTLNAKGMPVYDLNIKKALERGFTFEDFKTAATQVGIRSKKCRTGLSIQTYDLRQTIRKILTATPQIKKASV